MNVCEIQNMEIDYYVDVYIINSSFINELLSCGSYL